MKSFNAATKERRPVPYMTAMNRRKFLQRSTFTRATLLSWPSVLMPAAVERQPPVPGPRTEVRAHRGKLEMKARLLLITALAGWLTPGKGVAMPLELRGTVVIPHVQSAEMRYRREPDRGLGARVQLFLVNEGSSAITITPEIPVRLRGRTADELVAADEWAWHDFPSAWTNAPFELPPGALTVWSFNGKRTPWGTGTAADVAIAGVTNHFTTVAPALWLSAVTFLGDATNPFPNSLIFHVANRTDASFRLDACRLWLPADNHSWRALRPQPWSTNLLAFPSDGVIPAGDNGGALVATGPLPLTYAALEVRLAAADGKPVALWTHLRIKREAFDISGGWVNSTVSGRSTLTFEPFLKTLRRMHINTAHVADTPGYSDTWLYERYPLKYFNKLEPVDHYDTQEMLPRIHAVEFLGEPQYGGGRPVPPMTVWRALAPYQNTRLATSITHSEERIWRDYAGLSDFPHYDAYRVSAPSADAWSKYDRWGGQSLRWGAPLETIGDMTRSLRELNRPRPIAYWSQGAHEGWEVYGGRKRTSPTADELRAQAYHALANRITSLYWFNLSLKSLLKFPDLIEPITRVDREIRMLEDFYLEGDAFSYLRIGRDGHPDWDLSVLAGPQGALLFALDLDYKPDPVEKVFQFGPPREVRLGFRLPIYIGSPVEVFRVEADGIVAVEHTARNGLLEIRDRASRVAVYVATPDASLRASLEAKRQRLIAAEAALQFDPARNDADYQQLVQLLASLK